VIGAEFECVLAAAQEGSEATFSRLWRDGNPALLRYLRVTTPQAAEDVAAETWLQVVRGLAGSGGRWCGQRDHVLRNGCATRHVGIPHAAPGPHTAQHRPSVRAPHAPWLRQAERAPHAARE
jgi:hypothetical protein